MKKAGIWPYLIFISAALLLLLIKKAQQKSDIPKEEITISISEAETAINRNARIKYTKHARCRMICRHIDEMEVAYILKNGKINVKKIQTGNQGVSYPFEGITNDGQRVRIVFAPKGNQIVEVVTCIDLDTEWPCTSCN